MTSQNLPCSRWSLSFSKTVMQWLGSEMGHGAGSKVLWEYRCRVWLLWSGMLL